MKVVARFIALIAIFLAGCEKNSPAEDKAVSAIIKAEGPLTAIAGQEITIQVTLLGVNGCARPGGFSESLSGNTRNIAGKVQYEGGVCTLATVELPVAYKFKALVPGAYHLKFLTVNNTYIIHTITVS